MGFIDCDSHIIETDETWNYLDSSEERYRPLTVQRAGQDHSGYGIPLDQIWVIDDEWTLRLPGTGVMQGIGNVYDPLTTSLSDAQRRLDDMDVLGIDAQLLFTSVFLIVEVENPVAESVVKRSYNRWMAEGTAGSGGRLKWVAEIPTRTMTRAFEELEFAKEHGAGGIHLHGIEHGYYLDDPYFFPLYERVREMDLPILIHVGGGQRGIPNFPIGNSMPSRAIYVHHLAAVMTGFYAVLANDFHLQFPGLRWGFMEAGSTWAASVLHQHARLIASASDFRPVPIKPEVLEEKGIFIACETDENLPELIRVLGEDSIVTGTDYAHNDLGTQLDAHRTILDRTDISPSVARKIVDENGRRLLGTPKDFRPADDAAAAGRDRTLHIQRPDLVPTA